MLVGTQRALRVTPPDEALLFVVCAPVGPYFPKGFKPVSLHATTEYIRAAPGGMQFTNCGCARILPLIYSTVVSFVRDWLVQAWRKLRPMRHATEEGYS